VLDAARTGTIALFTSASLLAELAEVLQRPTFAQRLARANVPPHTLVVGYAALARLVVPAPIGPVVEADPDDDAVLACAVAARAEVVVSGDRELLALESYEGIPIITAAQLMARLRS
jgi:putative PIN family toxin of toxin-antitoxin system